MSDFWLRSYERFKKKISFTWLNLNYSTTAILPPCFLQAVHSCRRYPCLAFYRKPLKQWWKSWSLSVPLWISPKEEIQSGALLETAAVGLPGEIHPSLTTSALWSRTSVSSMTMSRGDIKLYCSRFQIICFRLIKVVKDRIRTVHQEDRLQNLIVCVEAVVDSAAAADSNDFLPNFKCV